MTENTAPTIEERYSSAINTSNLKVDRDHTRTNVADVIIAAGWSRAKLGVALGRLQSEWDGSARPRHLSPAAVRLMANSVAKRFPLVLSEEAMAAHDYFLHVNASGADRLRAAKIQADEWYTQELSLLFQKLKTLPEVRQLVTDYARLRGMEESKDKAAAVVSWWLHHTCPGCQGGKWEVIPGTNRHSNRACSVCKGNGDAPIPHGWEGRKLLGEMEHSVNQARSSMGAATSTKSRPVD